MLMIEVAPAPEAVGEENEIWIAQSPSHPLAWIAAGQMARVVVIAIGGIGTGTRVEFALGRLKGVFARMGGAKTTRG